MSTNTRSLFQGIAESIVGEITWRTLDAGYCARCPGRELHTAYNGRRDCIVRVSGAPTIYCVHSSCDGVVAERNRQLRSAIGKAEWQIKCEENPTIPQRLVITKEERARQEKQKLLDEITKQAKANVSHILSKFAWSSDAIEGGVHSFRDGGEGWRALLSLYGRNDTLWIGDRKESGDGYQNRFRTAAHWQQGDDCPAGPLMAAAVFKRGVCRRTAENVIRAPFLVVESDTLHRDEIGAVFAWLQVSQRWVMRAVIDTGGKSLHGWFDRPRARLQQTLAKLEGFGCDKGPWNKPCMSRLPSARRDNGRQQRLIWFNPSNS